MINYKCGDIVKIVLDLLVKSQELLSQTIQLNLRRITKNA